MSFILWSEKLSVHIDRLDRQHKCLIEFANNLAASILDGHPAEKALAACSNLVSYLESHFKSEEYLMQKAGYPGLTEHREKHRKLLKQIGLLKQKLERGTKMSLAEISSGLLKRLHTHISQSDGSYGKFINGNKDILVDTQ